MLAAFLSLAVSTVLIAKETKKKKKPPQYKKQSRDQLRTIAKGDIEKALKNCTIYLEGKPKDLETLYLRALAHSRANRPKEAFQAVKQALKSGLPLERFLAGPRDYFAPLYQYPPFKKLVKQKNIQLLHGPHLGSVTDSRARIWLRTASEVPINAVFTSVANPDGQLLTTKTVTSGKQNDYTAVLEITGLKPSTEYTYRLNIDGKPVILASEPSFRTFPKRGQKYKFTIGFGGGAGYTPWHEYMWNTILSHKPLAFMTLGDNVYIDTPKVPQVQKYCYYRRQGRREFRKFAASTPQFAIYDDHDFGDNDCTSTLDINDPEWKLPVLKVFTDNWVNPYYGNGEKNPGCFFDMSIADVDFFFLDTRFYRQDPKKIENPSILGPDQQKWLLKKLKNSTATFKVIASSVPMAHGVKPGSKDPWDGFPERREEIFSFIAENKIEGVFIIAADRHRSDAWKIERPGAYPLYEFMSSKLTNIHTHDIIEGSLFGYNETCSVGMLTFDTTKEDPEVTYNIVTIDNETLPEPYSVRLKKSQLSF